MNRGAMILVSAILIVVAGSIFSDVAMAGADDAAERKRQYALQRERTNRIWKSWPRRLEGPLRVENISDEEVREVQAVTAEVFPGAIVNISGVTDGCPCEDGPRCDSQVWIVAYRDNKNHGLMLSRVDDEWTIGLTQRWWLQYHHLRNQASKIRAERGTDYFEDLQKIRDALILHEQSFPQCSVTEQ